MKQQWSWINIISANFKFVY